jgi:hypothetical protein
MISKMQILLVRQILKALQGLRLRIANMARLVALLILHIAYRCVDGLQENCHGIAGQEACDGRWVARCFFGEEEVRTCNIACSVETVYSREYLSLDWAGK